MLHNLTAKQLQNDVGLNFTSAIQANGVATGTAYYLPQSLLQNTLAAFAISGTFNPNAPYIGPCTSAGQICDQVFLWGPWPRQVGRQLSEAHPNQGTDESRTVPRASAERLQSPQTSWYRQVRPLGVASRLGDH